MLAPQNATSEKHKTIIAQYRKAKAEFAEQHLCPDSEYDFYYVTTNVLTK